METSMRCGGEERAAAITKVLESVARKESAASRVLEAQGDRLRAILDGTASGDETLTQADAAMQATIERLIRLEQGQQSKLALLTDQLRCACAREQSENCEPARVGDNA